MINKELWRKFINFASLQFHCHLNAIWKKFLTNFLPYFLPLEFIIKSKRNFYHSTHCHLRKRPPKAKIKKPRKAKKTFWNIIITSIIKKKQNFLLEQNRNFNPNLSFVKWGILQQINEKFIIEQTENSIFCCSPQEKVFSNIIFVSKNLWLKNDYFYGS